MFHNLDRIDRVIIILAKQLDRFELEVRDAAGSKLDLDQVRVEPIDAIALTVGEHVVVGLENLCFVEDLNHQRAPVLDSVLLQRLLVLAEDAPEEAIPSLLPHPHKVMVLNAARLLRQRGHVQKQVLQFA